MDPADTPLRPAPPWALTWRRDPQIDRSAWHGGPWEDEPDQATFRVPWHPLPLVIARAQVLGALCGYAGVQRPHVAFGVPKERVRIGVHGAGPIGGNGVSFGGPAPGLDELAAVPEGAPPVWWFGFDCGHACDVLPTLPADLLVLTHRSGGRYRTIEYVHDAVTHLAHALDALDKPGNRPN